MSAPGSCPNRLEAADRARDAAPAAAADARPGRRGPPLVVARFVRRRAVVRLRSGPARAPRGAPACRDHRRRRLRRSEGSAPAGPAPTLAKDTDSWRSPSPSSERDRGVAGTTSARRVLLGIPRGGSPRAAGGRTWLGPAAGDRPQAQSASVAAEGEPGAQCPHRPDHARRAAVASIEHVCEARGSSTSGGGSWPAHRIPACARHWRARPNARPRPPTSCERAGCSTTTSAAASLTCSRCAGAASSARPCTSTSATRSARLTDAIATPRSPARPLASSPRTSG